ncbi:MAG: SUMF1/EgtB/PvdO family nonheme iron enzyme [Epsilonproteobacteria bacterium]|nr:SUMF1/EgtB/PvdO family nonheme iron enzyme [Campylobacterota bacterium]
MEMFIGDGERFRVVERLGSGGMGEVYKAYDRELREYVAIKTILERYVGRRDLINLFLNEAKTSLRVTHRSVIRVRDIIRFRRNYYLVMQFIDGYSLKSWMERNQDIKTRDAKKMFHMVKPILEALSYTHKYTIHRDIKPANIMVDRSGETLLMDFGIATVIDGSQIEDVIKERGMRIGTPDYMAPEQIRGVKDIDNRVDIYAMGVILYELLTKFKPNRESIKAPSYFNSSVSPELDMVILKMLEEDRERRYHLCDEVIDDIESIFDERDIESIQLAGGVSINRGLNIVDRDRFVYIPEGKFYRGSGPESKIDVEKPRRRLYLDGYSISIYPVTNMEYRLFLDENRDIKAPDNFDKICRERPNHPVVDVSWDEASIYCKWAGVVLPTEAQWEKASRGVKGQIYPWGNQFKDNYCNIEGGIGDTVAVDSFKMGVSPYGCYQMAGNVWEWCRDDFIADFYRSRDGNLDNPIALYGGDVKVLRGGAFNFVRSSARTSYRYHFRRDHRDINIGFRVVINGS